MEMTDKKGRTYTSDYEVTCEGDVIKIDFKSFFLCFVSSFNFFQILYMNFRIIIQIEDEYMKFYGRVEIHCYHLFLFC